MTPTNHASTSARHHPSTQSMVGPHHVAIQLLGGLGITIDGRAVAATSLTRRDPARLATFLALMPDRRVHREQLIEALWPDAPFESLANRLHKAVYFLRRATGVADSIVLSGDTVSLFPNARVTIDVATFEHLAEEAIANGDHRCIERAIALHTGDLLPYDLYEDWLASPRDRVRRRLRELLRLSGRFEQLLAMDPTDEDAHVGLIRTMLRGGDRAGALRQFETLRRVLDRELGVEPSREARELRDTALTGDRALDGPSRPFPMRARHGGPDQRRCPGRIGHGRVGLRRLDGARDHR